MKNIIAVVSMSCILLCLPVLNEAGKGGTHKKIAKAEQKGDVKKLIKMMQKDFLLDEEAAEALGRLGDTSAVPALIEALNTGMTSNLKLAAAEALGAIGDPRAIEPLASSLSNLSLYWPRLKAALLAFGEAIVEPVIQVMQSNKDAQRRAPSLLAEIGDGRAVEPLVALMQTSDEARTRREAVRALGALRSPAAVEPLLGVLAAGDEETRRCAADALTVLGPAGFGGLTQLLEAEEAQTRSVAIYAIGKSTDTGVTTLLLSSLRDVDSDVRAEAADALITRGDLAAVDGLIAALQDSVASVAGISTEVLGWLGSCAAVPHLIETLDREESDVREKAVWSLERITGLRLGDNKQEWLSSWARQGATEADRGLASRSLILMTFVRKGTQITAVDSSGVEIRKYTVLIKDSLTTHYERGEGGVAAVDGWFSLTTENEEPVIVDKRTTFFDIRPVEGGLNKRRLEGKGWSSLATHLGGVKAKADTRVISPDGRVLLQSDSVMFRWSGVFSRRTKISWSPEVYYTALPARVFRYCRNRLEDITDSRRAGDLTLVGSPKGANIVFDKDLVRVTAVLPRAELDESIVKDGFEFNEIGFTLITIGGEEMILPYMKGKADSGFPPTVKTEVFSMVPTEHRAAFGELCQDN